MKKKGIVLFAVQKQRKTPKNNYCIATEQKRMVNNKYKTYLREARLTTLIRNIFREEFENNKKNYLKVHSQI